MTRQQIVRQRLGVQRLIGAPFPTPEQAVETLGAVQAQDYLGARWALAQRCRNKRDTDIDAWFDRGALLRTHVLRPTWHFVLPADIRWMLRLTAPRIRAAMGYYDRQLGLDGRVFARSEAVLARALQGQQLTRTELGERLRGAGIEARGQRLGHLMMHAELQAIVCSGGRRGKQLTYALLEERAPERAPPAASGRFDRDQALAELARRYFIGHGPAQLKDFSWWSGLTMGEAQVGIEGATSHLAQDEVDGDRYWFARDSKTPRLRSPVVHLLPNYDEFVIAYKDRSLTLDPDARPARGIGNALDAHILAIDGRRGRRMAAHHRQGASHRDRSAVEEAARQRAGGAAGRRGRLWRTPGRPAGERPVRDSVR